MINVRKNSGITLIALIVMVIVIGIIAGISLTQGTELLKSSNVEGYVTNMITIRAKAKVYAEEVNSQVWDASDKEAKRKQVYEEKYFMTEPANKDEIISKVGEKVNNENGCVCYKVSKNTLEKMGLNELMGDTEDGDYVVVYNASDFTNIEIVYSKGISYKGKTYYTLSELQEFFN